MLRTTPAAFPLTNDSSMDFLVAFPSKMFGRSLQVDGFVLRFDLSCAWKKKVAAVMKSAFLLILKSQC